MGRFNRWDTPWINPKLIAGVTMIVLIVLLGLLGRVLWDENLAFVGSGPLSQPSVGVTNLRGEVGTWTHPLGTENSGRDMLALMIIGAPNSLWVGLVAATIGMVVGIILGFTAGFVGGKVDDVIRLLSDVTITIRVARPDRHPIRRPRDQPHGHGAADLPVHVAGADATIRSRCSA